MKRFTFTYQGKVHGQGRPRFKRNGDVYEAKSDKLFKKEVKQAFLDAGGTSFGDAPVAVTIDIFRALPKNKKRKTRYVTEVDAMKPDVDNIAKAVLDALGGAKDEVGVAFDDDKQVTELHVTKHDRRPMKDNQDEMEVTICVIQ